MSQTYRGDDTTALNYDFNDYGRIHVDADNPDCAQGALYALYNKISDSMSHPMAYQRWLDGYNIALIFAAAQRLGANGWATKDIDKQLVAIENRYTLGVDPSGACNNENNNTCMDDDTAAAAGYAWMAAYEARRLRYAGTYSSLAIQHLHTAMADVCIFNPTTFATSDHRTLCNGTVDQLASGSAVTISVNHLGENIPYGFGLMTGVSSAILGLNAAASSFPWQSSEITIAQALFAEAERHVDASSNFTSDCARPVRQPLGTLVITYDLACGDADPNNNSIYKPNMYQLRDFYIQQFGSIPGIGTYRSNYFDSFLFRLGPYDMGFFCFGRYITYGTHGYQWVVTQPEYMPYDYYDPIGYFEAISPTGLAQGWTCDQDKPTGRIWVDLYDDYGHKQSGFANSASEPAINQQCRGGSAHRFWIQLPPEMQGHAIRAYGGDYTWYGNTQLPCLQLPRCSW